MESVSIKSGSNSPKNDICSRLSPQHQLKSIFKDACEISERKCMNIWQFQTAVWRIKNTYIMQNSAVAKSHTAINF